MRRVAKHIGNRILLFMYIFTRNERQKRQLFVHLYIFDKFRHSAQTASQRMRQISTPRPNRQPMHSTNFGTAPGAGRRIPINTAPHRSGGSVKSDTHSAAAAALPAPPKERAIKLPASYFGSPVSLMALYDFIITRGTDSPSRSRC